LGESATRQRSPWESTRGWMVLSPMPNAPNARILCFSDVVSELESIGDMGRASGDTTGMAVAAACRRAQRLLEQLRAQFLEDVVTPDAAWLDQAKRPAV